MPEQNSDFTKDGSGAPIATDSLIRRARIEGLEQDQKLDALFVGSPSGKARQFLKSLSPTARLALENTARTTT